MPNLSTAEEMFWDNTMGNWRLAKARGRPRVRNIGGALRMTPDEVLAAIKKLGIKTTRRTIRRYENDELIPKPKRGGYGKGKGSWTDYPEDTPAEFCASYKLRHGQGYEKRVQPGLLARSRQKGLIMEQNQGLGFIDWVMGKGATESSALEAALGQQWLKEKHKALHRDGETCKVCKPFNRW